MYDPGLQEILEIINYSAYSPDAEQTKKMIAQQSQALQSMMFYFFEHIKKKASGAKPVEILSIGCAYSIELINIARFAKENLGVKFAYTGIDLKKEYVEAAQKMYSNVSYSNLEKKWLEQDFLTYPESQKFEAIILRNPRIVEDYPECREEAQNVIHIIERKLLPHLLPNGVLCISFQREVERDTFEKFLVYSDLKRFEKKCATFQKTGSYSYLSNPRDAGSTVVFDQFFYTFITK